MTREMEWESISRLMILGSPGTGKSTLSRFIGEKLNIEVFHLDKYFHKPNWEPRDKEEFRSIVRNLILKDKWVIDGNYSRTLAERIEKTDFIIFFDFPSYFCVYRILKRSFKTKLGLEKRTDLAEGCEEKWFDWEFVKFVWNFKKDYIPMNYKVLEELNFDKNRLRIFYNSRQVKKFLRSLK